MVGVSSKIQDKKKKTTTDITKKKCVQHFMNLLTARQTGTKDEQINEKGGEQRDDVESVAEGVDQEIRKSYRSR